MKITLFIHTDIVRVNRKIFLTVATYTKKNKK